MSEYRVTFGTGEHRIVTARSAAKAAADLFRGHRDPVYLRRTGDAIEVTIRATGDVIARVTRA